MKIRSQNTLNSFHKELNESDELGDRQTKETLQMSGTVDAQTDRSSRVWVQYLSSVLVEIGRSVTFIFWHCLVFIGEITEIPSCTESCAGQPQQFDCPIELGSATWICGYFLLSTVQTRLLSCRRQ